MDAPASSSSSMTPGPHRKWARRTIREGWALPSSAWLLAGRASHQLTIAVPDPGLQDRLNQVARSKTLVFTTCYNERDNIGQMIDEIAASVPGVDILVVDDNSPDGTWDVIEGKRAHHPNLHSVKRHGKLGIGSAHKYAIFYAMREGYETLVTMDADFSHDPKSI